MKRNTYYNSKYKKKYPYKKRRKFLLPKQVSGQTGIREFKLRYVTTAQTDAGGQILDLFCMCPTLAFNGGNSPADWTNVATLFDSFRVCAFKLKYVPSLPNDVSTTTGFYPCYVLFDVDSQGSVAASNTVALEYENCRVKNMYMPWSYYTKVPKPSSGPTIGWCDVATPTQQLGVVEALAQGLDISTAYGTWVSTYYMQLRDRR